MISSDEGFGILKNWYTHQGKLWRVTVNAPDDAFGPETTIESLSNDPPGIVLSHLGKSKLEALDLAGATFDSRRPTGFESDKFISFLSITLAGGESLLLVEMR